MSSSTDNRSRWEQLRNRLDAEARDAKMSHSAIVELSKRYGALSPSERADVDGLLAEWVLSDDETKRFDALALIAEHQIKSAAPALRVLGDRLEASDAPGAPYEWAKVNRILGKLTSEPMPE